jgi:YidC/Oxa1 family membrane protein insertase
MQSPSHGPDLKNLVIALLLATLIMGGWQYFFERPRLAALRAEQATVELQKKKEEVQHHVSVEKQHEKAIAGPRIAISTPRLHGSISLTGARLDTLSLADYRRELDKNSGEVVLLQPSGDENAYFTEVGFLGGKQAPRLPDASSVWQADNDTLTPEKPVTLRWNNGAGLSFEKRIQVDANYMFTISTTVKNATGQPVGLYPYGLISRNYADTTKHTYFMHEGPLSVASDVLNDVTYKKLREDGTQKFPDAAGWIGMADKYWLTAIIPDNAVKLDTTLSYFTRDGGDAYQADFRGQEMTVPANGSADFTVHMFAGAKVVKMLDDYRLQYNISLFDRAVDFGSLYFLTKPIFLALNFFHGLVGNFGVAILLLTVCIKLLLFPLANKSYTSMSQMKILMPQMNEIKDRYADDKLKMNQAVMELYKREGVNPMSGCLPILVQIPIFIALYRVLFVTIEMRHAPFFGWIHDLSAPDPTTVFNLFGLIPWDPPHFLHIGAWPIIMCITMVLQQRLNPKPTDPVQAAMIQYMPYVFLFLFANFPAGLVVYWAWNNTLSISQQALIQRRIKKHGHKKKKKAPAHPHKAK